MAGLWGELTLYVSHVELSLTAPKVPIEALRAVWEPATIPCRPVATRTRWRIRFHPDGSWHIEMDGVPGPRNPPTASAAVTLEHELVQRLVPWHPTACILHAGLVEVDGIWLLLVGLSGAGKSSLSAAAVALGGKYFSDEIVVTDGDLVWGIGRSTVFDISEANAPLPPRLASVDRHSYQFVDGSGRTLARPIARVPRSQWATEPIPARSIVVVRIEGQGPDRVLRMTAPHALATVIEANCSRVPLDLGALASSARALSVTWTTPERALALIAEATSHLRNR